MRVFNDLKALKAKGALPRFRAPVVTVGSFDGVHRGHKYLLEITRARACESGEETIVVTFTDHPRRILEPKDELMILNTLEEKALLIEKAGIDNLVVLPFEQVHGLSAEEFVRDVLIKQLGMSELVVGYNHRLGCDRAGAEDLKALGGKYGFHVHEAERLEGENGEKISSTEIRRAITNGQVEHAEKMLGRRLK